MREGNPDHRTRAELERGLKMRPEAPPEPDWRTWFPVQKSGEGKAENERARRGARAEWQRIVPILDAQGLLSSLDLYLLADYCVTYVRWQQCERDISQHGRLLKGERGWQRNGSIVSGHQYRNHLRFLVGQLGLSPVARDYVQPPAAEPEASEGGQASAFDV